MSPSRKSLGFVALFIATAAGSTAACAQETGNGFLFGAPAGTISLRGGWSIATARSDLFAYTTELLTLNRADFSSPSGDAEITFAVSPQTHIAVGVSVASRTKGSEYRHLIDNNDLPIEQKTDFSRVPVTIGVKQYLSSPGRSIGKFAWIPAKVAPYVGAGVGGLFYRFRQYGDFVDQATMDVFSDNYESKGWALTAHGRAGVEYSLSTRFALTAEGRYLWAKAPLSRDFSGFEKLDLSGISTSVGFTVRY